MPRVWKLGLEPDPWQRTKEGKPVEYRLNKPEWKDMAVGDIIEYGLEPERTEIVRVEVLELLRYPTFAELLDYCDQYGYIEPHRTKQDQLERLERRYPEEKRKQYNGVLGIRQRPLT
ncbi:MAG: hypothetical protein WEA04_03515 [Candidatus Andersenbacteria bacterium]